MVEHGCGNGATYTMTRVSFRNVLVVGFVDSNSYKDAWGVYSVRILTVTHIEGVGLIRAISSEVSPVGLGVSTVSGVPFDRFKASISIMFRCCCELESASDGVMGNVVGTSHEDPDGIIDGLGDMPVAEVGR